MWGNKKGKQMFCNCLPLAQVSAEGFEPSTVPTLVGMLYPAERISFCIMILLFQFLISRSRL
jgi:hypothetical protein